jgi:hypothetical protein
MITREWLLNNAAANNLVASNVVVGRPISLKLENPETGVFLSCQAGDYLYSEPKTYASYYKSIEIAIMDDSGFLAAPRDDRWQNDDVLGYVERDELLDLILMVSNQPHKWFRKCYENVYAWKIREEFFDWYYNCCCGWSFFSDDLDIVVYRLCQKIAYTLEAYGFKMDDITVDQVKDKFGGLRFYWQPFDYDKMDNTGCLKDIEKHIKNAEVQYACVMQGKDVGYYR